MPNRRTNLDHLYSAKFLVEIEGVTVGAFSAVEGVESSTDVVSFVDGGDMIVHKRPGRTHYSNIVLKRGYINTTELWDWYKAVIDGKIERKAGSIIVCDDTAHEIFRYNFFEGWPCRWKSLVMHADEPGTLVEEIEIAVEKIEHA